MVRARRLVLVVLALAFSVSLGPASADNVKDCGTTASSPNTNAQGTPFVTTTTQTSS